ncbi:hypothetical protein FRC91_07150 [Bradymonadales bacterium TMQ1]|uniref:TNFR-Cys domain-containing protein n=1 Tax=Lujinxingia sediminis TaxID=2480984 RepID=A0ABY0CTE2_9DELT|nr:hypothetical protein [Lujinxingia sediminis]RVU44722.1 hypothetical protein EA187_09265 [Lujinxingia sediminis]TXC76501.1 hypothetical protein FRC91_07150 [Bradymonadales bacterium TMQ1]
MNVWMQRAVMVGLVALSLQLGSCSFGDAPLEGDLCTNTCPYAGDGECDDGGEGALYGICALGTDCRDCGTRHSEGEPDPGPFPTPNPLPEPEPEPWQPPQLEPGEICTNTCRYAGDGQCDDGGPASQFSLCELGTDCEDCGIRVEGGDTVCVPRCPEGFCGADGCGQTCPACDEPVFGEDEARLRLIVGDHRGRSSTRKVCLYRAGDSQPFKVLTRAAVTESRIAMVYAEYVAVPAIADLQVAHLAWDDAYDESIEGCDASQARPLGDEGLVAGEYHTLVIAAYEQDARGSCAAHAEVEGCGFYPARSETSGSAAACPAPAAMLVRDGQRVDGSYQAGWRVVNVTANAEIIAASGEDNLWNRHASLFSAQGAAEAQFYNTLAFTSTVRVCPAYLLCEPGVDEEAQRAAVAACTRGEASWLLAELNHARLSAPDQATTVYAFGLAGHLNATGDGIIGQEISLVVAHDVSDGELP